MIDFFNSVIEIAAREPIACALILWLCVKFIADVQSR